MKIVNILCLTMNLSHKSLFSELGKCENNKHSLFINEFKPKIVIFSTR